MRRISPPQKCASFFSIMGLVFRSKHVDPIATTPAALA
jgi:hypothetical protein